MRPIWNWVGSPAYWTSSAFLVGINLTIATLGKTGDWLFSTSIGLGFYFCWKFSAKAAHGIKGDA